MEPGKEMRGSPTKSMLRKASKERLNGNGQKSDAESITIEGGQLLDAKKRVDGKSSKVAFKGEGSNTLDGYFATFFKIIKY